MKIGILGCGNWGSVFAIIQHKNGHSISLWEFDKERAQYVQKTRDNKPFLTGYKIPERITVDWRIEKVAGDCELLVFALPSQTLTEVVSRLKKTGIKHKSYLSLIKGLNIESLQRPSEIINELCAPEEKTYVLSGPCIANEIIRQEPTAVVLVGSDPEKTQILQHQLATEHFRIYLSDDIIGVELGAAIKNVIALGCGISDGLGYGNNAKGALITRGIIELQRLGLVLGADPKTFWGLSGLGDLITTAFSMESRNHRFGIELARGKSIEQIKKEIIMVAEGVPTACAVKKLIERYKIDMPICEAVYDIIVQHKQPKQALRELMMRPLKNE